MGEDAAQQIAGDVRSSRLPDVEEPNAEAVPRAQQRLLFRIPERKRVLAAQVLEKVAVPAREGGGDDRKIRGVRRQLQHVDQRLPILEQDLARDRDAGLPVDNGLRRVGRVQRRQQQCAAAAAHGSEGRARGLRQRAADLSLDRDRLDHEGEVLRAQAFCHLGE